MAETPLSPTTQEHRRIAVAPQVVPAVLADTLGGLEQRGEGHYVCTSTSVHGWRQDVTIRTERDGAETDVSVAVESTAPDARTDLLPIGQTCLVLAFMAREWAFPVLLAGATLVVAGFVQRRLRRASAEREDRERQDVVQRIFRALEATAAQQQGVRGYRVAPFEVPEQPIRDADEVEIEAEAEAEADADADADTSVAATASRGA